MTNEYNNKRYYWIKLKDTFFSSDTVDFLMSQNNGANYVVLYQMLCLKTVNTNGQLSRTIGEVLIPYDIEKIARDCKYFSVDTVRIALELYKKLGLIYEQENGIKQIANFDNLIGSESQNAIYRRKLRAQQRLDNVQQMSNQMSNKIKILDTRYKIEVSKLSKECVSKETTDTHTHEKPTIEEVTEYVKSQGLQVNAKRFFNYYESVGWKINGELIRDWRARLCLWDSEDKGGNNGRYGEINDL